MRLLPTWTIFKYPKIVQIRNFPNEPEMRMDERAVKELATGEIAEGDS